MDIMLASFGLAQDMYWRSKSKDSSVQSNFFYDLPPLSQFPHSLMIDVTPFILYDKVIINKTWIEQKSGLKEKIFSTSVLNSDTVDELVQKGIVEVRDYASDTANHLSLVETITNHDLKNVSSWNDILKKGIPSWRTYIGKVYETIWQSGNVLPKERAELYRQARNILVHSAYPFAFEDSAAWREIIHDYLLSINNTLLLSKEYSVGIFDWFDYEPFYTAKIMWSAMGSTSPISTTSQAGAILSFHLPLEKINSMAELIDIRDKTKGLREYLDAKQRNDKGADATTIQKILHEISHAQKNVERMKKIVSYFTIPLALIPVPLVGTALRQGVNDLAGWGIEKMLLEKYKWHFSLLDYGSTIYNRHALPEPTLHPLLSQNTQGDVSEFHQCEGVTKKGARCQNKAVSGSDYCHIHKP